MYTQEEYENNPLHGTSLEQVLTQLVDYYGWDILAAYLNLNCFKQNPSIKASLKFLKKTEWAQHKVESFYLYQFKNLPRASDAMFELPPRDRIVPMDQQPKDPKELSVEDGLRLTEKRETAAKQFQGSPRKPARQQSAKNTPYGGSNDNKTRSRKSDNDSESAPADPWENFKKR